MQRNYVMIRFLLNFCFIVLLGFMLSFCTSQQDERNKISKKELRMALKESNKAHVRYENQEIIDFLCRYKWPVEETGTGLRYYIYQQGDGPKVQEGTKIRYKYDVRFLNGNLVYSVGNENLKESIIPDGEMISGLLEGLKLLHEGDQAKIIIPSHLAFGVAGDGDRIPPYATLVYDLQVLKVAKPLN